MFEKIRENLKNTKDSSLEIPINLVKFEIDKLTATIRGGGSIDCFNGRFIYVSNNTLISAQEIPKYILDRFGFIDHSVFGEGVSFQCFSTKNEYGHDIPDEKGVLSKVCINTHFNSRNLYLYYNIRRNQDRYTISAEISANSIEEITANNFRYNFINSEDLRPQGKVSFIEALNISNILFSIRPNIPYKY